MTTQTTMAGRRRRAGWSAAAAALALAATLGACSPDKLLEVKDIDVVDPGTVNTPAALPAVHAGAIGEFQTAYSGAGDLANSGHEGIINISGMFGDELINAETFSDRILIDKRDVTVDQNGATANGTLVNLFLDLSRARAAADFAASKYAELDTANVGRSEVLSIGGFATTLFGEDFCSGVPFSTLLASGSIDYGQPLTTRQTLERALDKFDQALAVATSHGDGRLADLAMIGRGRVLLDLGRYAEAAAAVDAVPDGFRYYIQHSANTSAQYNGIWNFSYSTNSFSIPDSSNLKRADGREGGNGLPYFVSNDPRVPGVNTHHGGFGTRINFVQQTLYPTKDSDVPLATGIEARLIEAEAALHGTYDEAAFLSNLNAARAQFAGVPALTLADIPATDSARVDLLFRERAFDLYLTGHRLGDMRRLARATTSELSSYGRGAESVFPTGAYFRDGSAYGTLTSLPISSREYNNPNFQGCLANEF